MGAMFFVVAILGCGDGNVQCTDARIVPIRYETMAQCRAALPQQLAQNTDVPFPTIGADCRQMGPQMAKVEAKGTRG